MAWSRKLGKLESKMAGAVALNVVVPCHLKMVEKIDVDQLKKAVHHVVSICPMLHACIVKRDDGEFYFEPVSQISDVFEHLPSSTEWRDLCQKYCREPLRSDQSCSCLFKVFYIEESNEDGRMIVVYHHVIGDGTNGMTIVDDILSTYNELIHKIPLQKQLLPLPLSSCTASKRHLGDRYEAFRKAWVEEEIKTRDSFNCMMPFEIPNPPENSFLTFTGTCEEYDDFIASCQRHSVTVGCAYIAAMFFGHAALMFGAEKFSQNNVMVGCGFPVNLRNRTSYDLSASNVCMFVNNAMVAVEIGKQTGIGDLLNRVSKEVRRKLSAEHNHHLFDAFTDDDIANHRKVGVQAEKNRLPFESICVSNMRRYPGRLDYGMFKVESVHCVGGVWGPVGGSVALLMVYSTDKFNLSIVHGTGEMNTKRAKLIFDAVLYFAKNLKNIPDDFTVEQYLNMVEK